MLTIVVRHNTVDTRLERVTACEAQGVANIDDSLTLLGLYEAEFFGPWWPDLETPLFGEEDSEGADVCVLLVADVAVRGGVGWDVVHHG